MANLSLAQSCASHQINETNLDRTHLKIGQASAVLHIFSCWMDDKSDMSGEDYWRIKSIAFLLSDLLADAAVSLGEI